MPCTCTRVCVRACARGGVNARMIAHVRARAHNAPSLKAHVAIAPKLDMRAAARQQHLCTAVCHACRRARVQRRRVRVVTGRGARAARCALAMMRQQRTRGRSMRQAGTSHTTVPAASACE